jgi:hypothetical protein
LPIPEPPPVTSATLPLRFDAMNFCLPPLHPACGRFNQERAPQR